MLILILGDAAPLRARIALVGAVTLTNAFGILTTLQFRREQRRREVHRWWPTTVYGLLVGFSWPMLAIVGFPGADHVDMRAIIALFVCGVSATQIVSAASHRRYFFATQVPLLGVMTFVYLNSSDQTTHLLGFAFPIYLGVVIMLHHDVNKVVVSEIELKHTNGDLIANLTAEQAQAAVTNARLVEANQQLTEQALRDSLTGLANRTAFLESLDRAVASSGRHRSIVGVLFFDIDRFKLINDSLGHAAGDELLIAIAQRVEAVLRPGDVLGRLGGDEFVVALPTLADPYEAVAIAERVRVAVNEPLELVHRRVQVTISIGVATTDDKSESANDLLQHADAAQYRAKQSGRDRVEVFDVDLRSRAQHVVDTEIALRNALDLGHVVPWFQPQIDLQTGAVIGAEALARWVDPERGVIPPDEFLPLAEMVGLMFRVDTTIAAASVRARVRLAELGVDPRFRVWSNVSPGMLARGNQTERLAVYMQGTGCDPHGFGIEITETGVLYDLEAARRELTAARELGVRVALDDFGTGHSSLSLLRDLPIDEVKIDRTFVRDLTDDPIDAAIVTGVTEIARRIGLEVVAEGVERADQEAVVRELGCARAQGWLYGKAMPLDEFIDTLGLLTERPTPAVS